MAQSQLKEGSIRTIIADAPASGYVFDQWTGDIAYLDDPMASTTIVTMPAGDVSVTAGYIEIPYTPISYGLLYNYYAAIDVRNIAPTGWHLPSSTEYKSLADYLGAAGNYNSDNIAGNKLKEIGLTYWSFDTGCTNEVAFNGRGAGWRRGDNGAFNFQKQTCLLLTSDTPVGDAVQRAGLSSSSGFTGLNISLTYAGLDAGTTIRLIKDDSINEGIMTDASGKIYPTILIGSQVWMGANLATTKYRNGDWIDGFNGGVYTPISNATWATLTTGALCAYNNDPLNI